MGTGIADIDDLSMLKVLHSVAVLQNRNYVVAEIKGNLSKEDRAAVMAKFSGFKFVAHVAVGEPTADFKDEIQELLLKQKQENADRIFKAKKFDEARQKILKQKQKELEKQRKKAENDRKRKLEEIEKAKAKEEGKEVEEKKADEAEEAEEAEEPEADAKMEDEEPPKVTLTDEEENIVFRVSPTPDLLPVVLSKFFVTFTLPTKDEGFAEVKYVWSEEKAAQKHLKEWIVAKKLTTRVEELEAGVWFHTEWRKWQQCLQQWQHAQKAYKAVVAQKQQAKVAEAAKKAAAEKLAAAKKLAEAAKEGKDKKDEDAPMEQAPAEAEAKEAAEPVVDFENVDIFGIPDIKDIGGGMPLFHEFAAEDWLLMSLGFELHLMAHAFKKDINDSERSKIHADHIAFYFEKYYKKPLNLKNYGVETIQDLVALAKDVVYITKAKVLESALNEEMESFQVFVKLAEEGRRHRNLLFDAGDASVKLNFPVAQPQSDGKGDGKGFGKGPAKGQGKSVLPPFAAGKGVQRPPFQAAMPGNFAPNAKGGNKGGFRPQGFGAPAFGNARPAFKGAGK